VWQFTNSASVIGVLSNLPPGSDYAFENFNNEPLPRFWLYVPGGTNITIRSLVTNGAGFDFGAAATLTCTQAVERVYVVGTKNDGSAIIQFGDGIQGARLPGGSPSLAARYSAGAGSHFTGVAALSDGKFVLLSAPTGTVSSVSAQVMTFNGTNYTQISSNNLSALTTRTSRATLWLFQNEPFVNSSANFIASLNAPDWSSSANGLPGSIVVPPTPAVAKPGLFIRTEPNAIVVYWSTNYDGFVLEYTADLAGNPTWTEIDRTYFLAGGYYEYHEARSSQATKRFYRLRYPGMFFLTPSEAELSFELQSNQAVLTWPADYVGYTLESTTNLAPPAIRTPIAGSYGITNGQFEFRQNLPSTKPHEFFRLRWS
jgi:hypothetical protein